MKIIYVIGTDGAGKTTIAKRLVAEPFRGFRLRYAYCQLTPILLAPLKLFAWLIFLRKTDRFQDYRKYQTQKATAGHRYRWLTRFYCNVWLIDQAWQTWLKLLPARCCNHSVIIDRYYLDSIVNTGVLLTDDALGMLQRARFIEHLLPRPDVCVFLDVSEEVASSRKRDIPSTEYLRERKERYLQLAPHYHFQIVDANQDLETVFQRVRQLVETTLAPGGTASGSASAASLP